MRQDTIARNYADALLTLGTKAENREGFGAMIQDVANAMQQDQTLWRFMESPRISAEQKNTVLSKAFGDRVPRVFLRFLQVLVRHRRQMLIPEITTQYASLLDEALGRVHANVTVASASGASEVDMVAERLSKIIGKQVVPHIMVNPSILGGVVIKFGDTVMDGSVRRRLERLAQRMRMSA